MTTLKPLTGRCTELPQHYMLGTTSTHYFSPKFLRKKLWSDSFVLSGTYLAKLNKRWATASCNHIFIIEEFYLPSNFGVLTKYLYYDVFNPQISKWNSSIMKIWLQLRCRKSYIKPKYLLKKNGSHFLPGDK